MLDDALLRPEDGAVALASELILLLHIIVLRHLRWEECRRRVRLRSLLVHDERLVVLRLDILLRQIHIIVVVFVLMHLENLRSALACRCRLAARRWYGPRLLPQLAHAYFIVALSAHAVTGLQDARRYSWLCAARRGLQG